MDLVFDVGNTEIVIGVFDGDELRGHWRIASDARRTPDELGVLLGQLLATEGFEARAVASVTTASVVPPITTVIDTACRRYFGVESVAINARTPLPIRLEVEEPLTVGADRIANTLAASRLYGVDTIVVDLGTATTYDCITAEGTFIGGVIAPGVRTAAERLTERTAKLPRVELKLPRRVIGRRTETCLQSGIFYNAVDAIDGMVRRIRDEWERPDALVVATGGLAPLIGPECTTVTRIEPLLTLHGLRIAHAELADHPPATPDEALDAALAAPRR
jgi:type III pantothenate kinase